MIMNEAIVQKEGIKETTEAAVAVATLVKFGAAQAKDGLDMKDLGALGMKLATDEAFRAVFLAAFDGAAKIPAEVKDITMEEAAAMGYAVFAALRG
jgi:hypothetical protein